MKKLIAFVLVSMMVGAVTTPAFADGGSGFAGEDQTKNVRTGTRNVSTSWVEVMDETHKEVSKGKNMPEHLTGVVAGGAVGVRRAIHRTGAGVIDLLTFWIPKKQPLVNPEKPRLE